MISWKKKMSELFIKEWCDALMKGMNLVFTVVKTHSA